MSHYTDAYVEKQLAAIARVRELHREDQGTCMECRGSQGYKNVPYPCLTIQALDGEQ